MRHQVLLYDGLCGFCDRTVQFVLARDPGGRMRFAPLQGDFAGDVLRRFPALAGVDSLVLVDVDGPPPGAPPLVRSDAILSIVDYLGWPWRAAVVFRLVPRFVRDWAYDLFARHRYRLFGRYDACPLPSPGTRARFID
ncbi:MAG TPA: DCC1-like thiol-disulfide oxidoreductase family protein [Gemmatimonadales bacterium]|nr:DCC1-like thiol-disulfide oxidoreductase family protein [Gemmatimonadales bacterium]